MELRSQEVRTLAPENDPLKMGMGWKVEDLSKPQILVESTFGDSHPGSAHLDQFVKEAVQAVNKNGGKAARYFATDMCDGIAQGHDGINYSLPHRDAIVNLVEAQANASVYDGGVFIASCDKSVPAMLMSIGRLKDMSAIVVTGGVMEAHTLPKKYVVNDPACAINDLLTLEQIGKFDAWEKTGVIPNEQLDYYKHNACPSCGACSFMGTASTMQIMAEALGLMLPGTALMPATAPELKQAAYDAGVQVMKLVAEGIKAKATAEAEATRLKGEADGASEKSRGEGIAAGVKAQAAAYNGMENPYLLANRYIDIMPQVAEQVAKPLTAVDSIKMYGSGNAQKLVKETTAIVDQVASGLKDSTGVDLPSLLSGLFAKPDADIDSAESPAD